MLQPRAPSGGWRGATHTHRGWSCEAIVAPLGPAGRARKASLCLACLELGALFTVHPGAVTLRVCDAQCVTRRDERAGFCALV